MQVSIDAIWCNTWSHIILSPYLFIPSYMTDRQAICLLNVAPMVGKQRVGAHRCFSDLSQSQPHGKGVLHLSGIIRKPLGLDVVLTLRLGFVMRLCISYIISGWEKSSSESSHAHSVWAFHPLLRGFAVHWARLCYSVVLTLQLASEGIVLC